MQCPCVSGLDYDQCCEPVHLGSTPLEPSAVMRARFSAFKLGLRDFLLNSWHPDTRPSVLELAETTQWGSLHIHHQTVSNNQGEVHFSAYFFEEGLWGVQEEHSVFMREQGTWYYHSGEPQVASIQPERNASCPCGSGKKFKRCCIKRT